MPYCSVQSRVPFVAAKGTESRPGESKRRFPQTPTVPYLRGRRLHMGRLRCSGLLRISAFSGSNPSQSRRTPSQEALVQPLEGCCTISLFSGALRTGIDGLFDFFDSLAPSPPRAKGVFFISWPGREGRPPGPLGATASPEPCRQRPSRTAAPATWQAIRAAFCPGCPVRWDRRCG